MKGNLGGFAIPGMEICVYKRNQLGANVNVCVNTA